MRYLSLFSGIEAASIAWIPLGWECVGVAEIEPFPCKVLAHHYPGVPNLGSVTDITEEQIKALGHIDLVVGGFPCQDLSVAGKRKGLRNEDGSATRSGLFFTAMRIVEWANPRWVIVENVPGLFSSQKGGDFAAVVGEMAGCEFDVPRDGWRNSGVAVGNNGLVEWVTLDAQFCRTPIYPRAVPQRRRRVFVIRDSGDWSSRPPLFFDSESLRGNPPPSRKTGQEVAGTISKCSFSGGAGGRPEGAAGGHFLPVARSILAKGNDSMAFDLDTYVMSTGQAGAEIGIGITLNCNHEAPIVAGTLLNNGKAAGSATSQDAESGMLVVYPINDMATRYKGTNGSGAQTGKGHGLGIGGPEAPMYTLTKGDKHAVAYRTNAAGQVNPQDGIAAALNTQTDPTAQFIAFGGDVARTLSARHDSSPCADRGMDVVAQPNMQVRRLTPTECGRLQGFPDGYLQQVPGYSDSAAYKSFGNSMAVNVMQVLGERIQMVESLSKERIAA